MNDKVHLRLSFLVKYFVKKEEVSESYLKFSLIFFDFERIRIKDSAGPHYCSNKVYQSVV